MSNNKPKASPPAAASAPLPTASDTDAYCEGLRASIRRLQGELADRQADARPMPSSVMRAYQKLIDRHLSDLASHNKLSENS